MISAKVQLEMEEISLEDKTEEQNEETKEEKDQIHSAIGSVGKWQVRIIFITGKNLAYSNH